MLAELSTCKDPFNLVRPERFELPTSWFVARRDRKSGNLDFCKSLNLNNHARGMSVAKCTQEHDKAPLNHAKVPQPPGYVFEYMAMWSIT